jgi:hypothetical protein
MYFKNLKYTTNLKFSVFKLGLIAMFYFSTLNPK